MITQSASSVLVAFHFTRMIVFQCVPFNYEKSADGSICEVRPYLLEDSVVYLPFIIASVVLAIVSVTSFFVTQRKSLLITNTIALLSLTEFASILTQFIIAY